MLRHRIPALFCNHIRGALQVDLGTAPRISHAVKRAAQEVCSNGVPGVEGFGVCCAAECGACGGVNCKGRAEAAGLTADFCCAGRISNSGVYCDDFGPAPCIIGECFRLTA